MRLLLLALVLLTGCPDTQRQRALEEQKKAEVARMEAEKAAAEAAKKADEARQAVEALQKKLDETDAKVAKAVDDVASAPTEADRNAATARLRDAQAERQTLASQVAEAKANAQRAERTRGVKISTQCIDNPLAKGCN